MKPSPDKLYLSGTAAYTNPAPPPRVQRRLAIRAEYEAHMSLRFSPGSARELQKEAIEALVDAFLLDRLGNADCFARAHAMGNDMRQRFGCPFQEESGLWFNPCGIMALHSRMGQSVGGIVHTSCSICGAGAFQCDHVAGGIYDGSRCSHPVTRWDVEEVSVTPWPRDPRCYRLTRRFTLAEVEKNIGHPLPPGAVLTCNHCRDCSGEPTEDDFDVSLFPELTPPA